MRCRGLQVDTRSNVADLRSFAGSGNWSRVRIPLAGIVRVVCRYGVHSQPICTVASGCCVPVQYWLAYWTPAVAWAALQGLGYE